MDFKKLNNYLAETGEPKYRFRQCVDQITAGEKTWTSVSTLPKRLQEILTVNVPVQSWIRAHTAVSADGTVKAALTLLDGSIIETVLMEPKPGHWSVCISCEVGCPMNCAFCATGKLGFTRALTPEEISDQLLFWKQYARYSKVVIKSVVFMGMGEPFHNREAVFTAIDWINIYFGLGYRHISVSTCGIPEGIAALSQAYPQVNLAISLHSAMSVVRSQLMPVEKAYDLNCLGTSVEEYIKITNREVMFEYLLIQNLNDTKEAADALISWLNKLPKRLVHVNLIRYNETGRGFVSPSKNRVRWFKEYLESRGISSSIRKSLGQDIAGACGQLAAKQEYHIL